MTWVSEGRQRGEIPVDFEIFRKKVVFVVSLGKKQILPLLFPLEKVSKNLLMPLWKQSSRRPWLMVCTRRLFSNHNGILQNERAKPINKLFPSP